VISLASRKNKKEKGERLCLDVNTFIDAIRGPFNTFIEATPLSIGPFNTLSTNKSSGFRGHYKLCGRLLLPEQFVGIQRPGDGDIAPASQPVQQSGAEHHPRRGRLLPVLPGVYPQLILFGRRTNR
jgi:hypothetical protein